MTKFEAFGKEKQYLLGVSPATLDWYEQILRWLNTESPSKQDLKDVVLRMRTAGLKPSSCNSRIEPSTRTSHGLDRQCNCHDVGTEVDVSPTWTSTAEHLSSQFGSRPPLMS